jgi:hypothetical protein
MPAPSAFHLIFGFVLFLSIATYLGSFAYLLRYLRRAYMMVWIDLGEPSFSQSRMAKNPFQAWVAALNAFQFVFSSDYRAAQDRRLTMLIWLVRIFFVVSILLFLLDFSNLV